MDFFKIKERVNKNGGVLEVYPGFLVQNTKDLMVRGGSFYAVWDEEAGLWSTNSYRLREMVDAELAEYVKLLDNYEVKYLNHAENKQWNGFRKYIKDLDDSYHQLDEKLVFSNQEVKKNDFASKTLPYPLEPGDHSAWDELVGTLYRPSEREKIEWAIGAVVSGDSKRIQKFVVLYGEAGTGKSTILNIIQKLFQGYYGVFEAKELVSNGNAFATEAFKHNPLVAIQHDGDLSRIADNTKFNSIVSHEEMLINEKYKASYKARFNAFIFMGTNSAVQITDSKSGLLRRLIDVHPSGAKIPFNHYRTLVGRCDFELGAIAAHCLNVFHELGPSYYDGYRPEEMMRQTDVTFNFIESILDLVKEYDGISLKRAYTLYKEYCDESNISRPLPMYKFRGEIRDYFEDFTDDAHIDGQHVRSWYSGFKWARIKSNPAKQEKPYSLVLDSTESLFDEQYATQPAQGYRTDPIQGDIPAKKWANVTTCLADLDTRKLHYVKVPEHHIVIDFDLVDSTGNKSLELNLEAASKWPPTYAELSKGGNGIHLHYNYDGDVTELSSVYSEGIEVKTLLGDASLRRRLSKCNNIPVATINSGLPLKEKKVINAQTIQSERGLRDLIGRNLRKEIHPGTKPSVDFIAHILEEAYDSGMVYDVSDLKPRIIAFANGSTNQPLQALKVVQDIKWKSETEDAVHVTECQCPDCLAASDDRLVHYDLEVYPNLFVVCWKYDGTEGRESVIRMINPSPEEVGNLFSLKLVGYNNRRYDNHILWARYMGYSNEQLYKLSQKVISNDHHALFGEAYNLSYTDIYDFTSKKQSLKRYMIELGIHKMEMDIPWDQPVSDEDIPRVVEYCVNDVMGTEATFHSRKGDWQARLILAELSGLTPNDTTQKHTARIIFGNDKRPQSKFVYTDLSKEFNGYTYDYGKSYYRGELVGEGGYVYAEPGIYTDVALLDVASMHPTSIVNLNLFGEYTKRFEDLLRARLAIKRGDDKALSNVLDGRLSKYLDDPEMDTNDLSYALKIAINIVYGLTSAKFENPFKDNRNKDNIVAKRGALFMIDLKHFVQERGFTVAHIKTDSIKIPNATPEIIQEVMEFGKKYGYDFEHEATYEKMALVNDAVYVAKYGWAEKEKLIGQWTATGAQFAHPYVFKTLFTGDPIEFDDLCETKQVVQGVMYLDLEWDRPTVLVEGMQHIGRTGRFVPVVSGGGMLYRVKDDKPYTVTGTKGHLWLEADMAESMADDIDIDMSYFEKLVDAAKKQINKFGNFEEFVKR